MALIVEDGSGIADAESYISVSDAVAYAEARGLTFPGTTGPEITAAEQALRRATEFIDQRYGSRFIGQWTTTTQALAWPRVYAYYRDEALADDFIPPQVKAATVQAAVRELASPGSLTPDVTTGTIKKRVRVEGAVEVEYAVGAGNAASQTPIVSIIDQILAPLLAMVSSAYSGIALRG